jgi:outer membrane scaffolding protein for murein synthesis (MipA/OmpV family)
VKVACSALALAAVAFVPTAAAREEPLWEAGLGVSALHFPDYRGAAHARAYALPLPYFVYHGDFFKSDRHGMRGIFFKTDQVDFNLSVGASLPVSSAENPERKGMPDLKPAFEIGPSLDVTMWRSDDRRARLDLRLPVRGAISVESSPRYIGTQFFPHANVDVRDPAGFAGWNLGVLAGPVYTDSRYNRYYYEVPSQFATPDRPAYTPGGGFGGLQFIVALSKRFPKFWAGGFVRYDTLRGAAFEASPLVTSKRYLAGGLGIAWIFAESAQRVPDPDFRAHNGRAYAMPPLTDTTCPVM